MSKLFTRSTSTLNLVFFTKKKSYTFRSKTSQNITSNLRKTTKSTSCKTTKKTWFQKYVKYQNKYISLVPLRSYLSISLGQIHFLLFPLSTFFWQSPTEAGNLSKKVEDVCVFLQTKKTVNDRSCIFTFGQSRRPKTEKYLAKGWIPKPNIEIFINCYPSVVFPVLILIFKFTMTPPKVIY